MQPLRSSDYTIHDRDVVLQSDSVTLWYYPTLKIVHHQMTHPPTSPEFRELLLKGTELVERHRAPKWLSDDRGNTVLRPHDEEWAQQEWLPRVLAAGFKYWAIVLPAAAVGKLNMRRLAAEHEQRGIVSHVETSPYPAFEWLMEQ